MNVKTCVATLLCLCLAAGSAGAAQFVFSSGTRAGQADFEVIGNDLVITLVNTSPFNTSVPNELLSALFFDIAGSPSLTPVSGILSTGSVVMFGVTPADGVIGGEWAYSESAAALAPGGAAYGVSSAGFGIFGPFDRFPGPDLDGQVNVGGMSYSLLSEGNIAGSGNAPVTGANPLIDNGVVLSLSGLPAGFNTWTDITNVWFQYGTDLQDPRFQGNLIPEPMTITAVLIGVGGLARYIRRRRLNV